jgi:hypothetical protein
LHDVALVFLVCRLGVGRFFVCRFLVGALVGRLGVGLALRGLVLGRLGG